MIQTRKFLKDREYRTLLSWQTRTLAQFIAATVEVAENGSNPLADDAQTVAIDKIDVEELKRNLGQGDSDTGQEKHVPAVEPRLGSYEKLMMGFGGGAGSGGEEL